MRTTQRHVDTTTVTVVVFDKGDEVVAGLVEAATTHDIEGAGVTGVGAFARATLGFFDRERKDYERIEVDEQVEVLSLVGDITLDDGEPMAHLHVVVGRRDGSTVGGHILEAEVWPTLELVVTGLPDALHRVHDPETGLALIDPTRHG